MRLLPTFVSHRPDEHFTQANPQSALGRVAQFPLMRVLIALLFLAPVLVLAGVFRQTVVPKFEGDLQVLVKYAQAAVFVVLFSLAYRLYARVVEKRKALEFSGTQWYRELGFGFLVTALLMSVIVAILFVSGMLQFTGLHDNPRIALDMAVFFSMSALIEELLFRLILFKLLEEWLGTGWACGLQVGLFGLAHLANDNATLWSAFCVAAEGGVILTAGYILTRRLWLPLGLHIGWNYAQSGLFSVPTSGFDAEGLIRTELHGPELLTGGSFGIEGSILAVALCLVVGIWLLCAARQNNQFIGPRWTRTQKSESPESPTLSTEM